MKIMVCIKQVPEITEVKIDPVTHTLVREGVPSILNPFDEFAVEEALRIREKHGGEVTVITMGPPQAKEALVKCLAMGADKAILLTDRAFAGADTWATAYTLSSAIKQLEYDVVFCGKQAIDGDTAQVGPELAENLGIPQITFVRKIEIDPKTRRVLAHRETEEGYEVVECRLPVLLTAIKGLNEPRLPTLMGIMNANRKEIKTIPASELGTDVERVGLKGSFTEVVNVFAPEPRGKGAIITEPDPSTAARKIVEFLRAKAVI
ncbi:MAG: electron transfer flavoprotein subunit beta/FixA family protein [archaeon]